MRLTFLQKISSRNRQHQLWWSWKCPPGSAPQGRWLWFQPACDWRSARAWSGSVYREKNRKATMSEINSFCLYKLKKKTKKTIFVEISFSVAWKYWRPLAPPAAEDTTLTTLCLWPCLLLKENKEEGLSYCSFLSRSWCSFERACERNIAARCLHSPGSCCVQAA